MTKRQNARQYALQMLQQEFELQNKSQPKPEYDAEQAHEKLATAIAEYIKVFQESGANLESVKVTVDMKLCQPNTYCPTNAALTVFLNDWCIANRGIILD